MSKILYLPFIGNPNGGGPHIFVYKFALAVQKKGIKVIYDKPQRADVALGIIESGKLLRKTSRAKTKLCVRIDNAYFKEYWHGGPGREWRPDMTALHKAIVRDFDEKTGVDHVIFQSEFSKNLIGAEISERKKGLSIIHNGVDVKLFRPTPRALDGFINLFHIGKMRNGYIMESLIGTYNELRGRGHKVRLILAGNMDAECSKVYNDYKAKNTDPDLIHLGACPNTTANNAFNKGDIYLGPRMGSSCDNVIVESLSCGLPVVIPKWGGNSELVEDGVQGVVVDSGGRWNYGPDYIQKLADGVERVIPNVKTMRVAARQHAVKNFTIDKMVDKYLKVMGL